VYTAQALAAAAPPRKGLWWLMPREYGAWSMLMTGYVTTLAVADALTPAALWLLPAMILLLCAKEPLERLLRTHGPAAWRYLGVFLGELLVSGACGSFAAASAHNAAIYLLPILAAPFYAVAILLGFWGERWRTLRELVATWGLLLVVPGTWLALGLMPDMAMWIVYLGLVLHFLYGVAFLRLQIVAARTDMDHAEVRQGTILLAGSASLITVGVVVVSLFGYLPIWAAVPLLPQMVRAYLWLGSGRPWLEMNRMGRQEVALALSLLLLFTLVAHA